MNTHYTNRIKGFSKPLTLGLLLAASLPLALLSGCNRGGGAAADEKAKAAAAKNAGVQVVVTLKLTLVERASGKVLFERPSMEVRERYEIGSDQRAYLEESDAAVDRLSRDVARSVVSAVLEGF